MKRAIPVLHRDPHLLVVCKPSGLLSVPTPGASGPTLPGELAAQGLEVFPVHRLDRDVSGVVLLALDEATRRELEDLFRERALEKTYWALCQGRIHPAAGALKFPILDEGLRARVSARGKPSHTAYRTLRNFAHSSELEIDLITGRYNQIRLHLAHAGFPLVGERKYARGREDPVGFKRVALHARRLAFRHPRTGAELRVEAPLPADLERLLEKAAGRPGE